MISFLFFWFSVFVSVLSVSSYQYTGTLIFPEYISAFFLWAGSVFLFPLFRVIEQDSDVNLTRYQKILFLPIVFIATGIMGFFFHLESLSLLLTALIFLTLFCIFEVRVLFIFAFLLLIETILFLLIDKNPISESLSIFLYYALCAGVFISLLQPWIYKQIQKYIPRSKNLPSVFDAYFSELKLFARIFSRLIPLIFLILLLVHHTRFSSMILFDSRFLMTLSLFFLLTQTVGKKIWKYDMFLGWILIILGGFLLFLVFPFSLPVALLTISFWIISSLFLLYRGEYVKKVAYRFFSL